MAQQILMTNEFDINNVSFTKPRKNNMGGQNILVNYLADGRNGPLILQTPRLRAPFGLDRQDNDGAGPIKYNVNVSLAHGENPNPTVQAFTENIQCVDNFVREKGAELSESWFGKQKSSEFVNELFRSCEKKPKDGKWASTLKLKLPLRDGKPTFTIYDDSRTAMSLVSEDGSLNLDCIQRGCEVVAIIQCTGVWFMGKTQFGIGWKVLQMKLYQTNKLIGYSIVDDDPVEEDDEDDNNDVE
jgi:hypothetical protein